MTNAGSFDEWMADTETLINLIKEIGNERYIVREYNSPHFSYSYNGNNWIFKYNRELTPVEDIKSAIPTAPILPPNFVHSGVYSSNSTTTMPGVNHVIITLGGTGDACIKSVQWIHKPNGGLVMISTADSTFDTMGGGRVRGSFLFLSDMKILVNDKIYSHETPEAFTNDLEDVNTPYRYLDLLYFREKYDEQLY